MRKSLQGLIAAGALLALSAAAEAAGLGKLTVLSNLGEPLRAEIDVVAVEKTELESLIAKLGTPDAYAQSNLPFPPPSLGLKLSIEKRASGEPYISAATVQPVNEPFVDILVDLSWNGGRIQRAYTALLDPPTFATEQPRGAPPAAAAAPEVRPAPVLPPEPQVQTQLGSEFESKPAAPIADETPPAAAPEEGGAPMAEAAAPSAEGGVPPGQLPAEMAGETHTTKRGDNLSKIARKHKPDDVSLEQMLVALFRSNPEAFTGKNMNRLKTGKVLEIPEWSEVSGIDAKEARKEVRLQIADFNAYREKLAGMTARDLTQPDSGQAAAGKLSGPLPEQAPAGQQPKEVLKLSKGDVPGAAAGNLKAAQDRIRSLEEDVAARDKTIGEQRERVAKLEKTIKDMQALIDIKSKGMAELQKPATTPTRGPGAKEPAVAPAMPPAMPEPPKPEMATGPSSAVVAPTEPVAPGMPAAQSGVAAPAKPKRPKIVVTQPQPEPSLVDTIMGEPMYLAAGGGAIVLLGGLAYVLVRRRRSGGGYEEGAEKKTSELGSADETAERAPAPPSLAGATPRPAAAAQVTEEVDPLAEAEIYLAYGRDGQAEDILKEALATSPRRQEVQLKLLEIYAKRKDVAAFDTIARDLQVTTGGQGEVWAQAATLGYTIDPNNPRYSAGKVVAAAAAGAAAGGLEDKLLDFNIGMEEADVGTKTDIDLSRLAAGGPSPTTDIDLTSLGGPSGGMTDIDLSATPEPTVQPGMIDLDLGPGAEPEKVDTSAPSSIDFDFDLSSLSAAAPAAGTQTVTRAMQQTVADVGSPEGGALEFDLSKISLDEPEAGRQEPTMELSGAAPVLPEIDLSNINLDLGGGGGAESGGGGEAPKDDRWYDVQTKFDLAKAYQEMGDKEGAREILHEVIAEGDAEQKSAAQKVLQTLA